MEGRPLAHFFLNGLPLPALLFLTGLRAADTDKESLSLRGRPLPLLLGGYFRAGETGGGGVNVTLLLESSEGSYIKGLPELLCSAAADLLLTAVEDAI